MLARSLHHKHRKLLPPPLPPLLLQMGFHTHQTRSRNGRFWGHSSLWGCRCDCFSLSSEISVRGSSCAGALLLVAGACMHGCVACTDTCDLTRMGLRALAGPRRRRRQTRGRRSTPLDPTRQAARPAQPPIPPPSRVFGAASPASRASLPAPPRSGAARALADRGPQA